MGPGCLTKQRRRSRASRTLRRGPRGKPIATKSSSEHSSSALMSNFSRVNTLMCSLRSWQARNSSRDVPRSSCHIQWQQALIALTAALILPSIRHSPGHHLELRRRLPSRAIETFATADCQSSRWNPAPRDLLAQWMKPAYFLSTDVDFLAVPWGRPMFWVDWKKPHCQSLVFRKGHHLSFAQCCRERLRKTPAHSLAFQNSRWVDDVAALVYESTTASCWSRKAHQNRERQLAELCHWLSGKETKINLSQIDQRRSIHVSNEITLCMHGRTEVWIAVH